MADIRRKRVDLAYFHFGYTGCSLSDYVNADTSEAIEKRVFVSQKDGGPESHVDGLGQIYDGEPLFRVKALADLPIVKGFNALIGGHGSGKTPFMRDTLLPSFPEEQVTYVRFGEPWIGYATRGSKAAAQILSALEEGNKIIFLDSTKNLIDRMSGSLGKEGINRPFFAMLSDWSAVAMERNCAIIGVINLLSDSESVLTENVNRLNSSTNNVIVAEGGGNFTYKVRDHDNVSRINGSFYSDGKRFSHNGVNQKMDLQDPEVTSKLILKRQAFIQAQLLAMSGSSK